MRMPHLPEHYVSKKVAIISCHTLEVLGTVIQTYTSIPLITATAPTVTLLPFDPSNVILECLWYSDFCVLPYGSSGNKGIHRDQAE